MSEKFNYVTIKFIHDTETPFNEDMKGTSLFFNYSFKLGADTVIGPLASDVKKDPSLGILWENILPTKGIYNFEIATELPYFLPNINNKAEYKVLVDNEELFVCNRMTKAYHGDGIPKSTSVNYFLMHILATQPVSRKISDKGLLIVPMKSFISKRFSCKSDAAERAITNHFIEWREKFLSQLITLSDGLRVTGEKATKHLLPHMTLSSFPIFWLAIEGAEGKKNCAQFTGDAGIAAFRPMSNLAEEHLPRLNKILSGEEEIDPHSSALSMALTFCHYGYLDLALVQVCTGCESFLSELLLGKLKERGVSNSHIKKYFDDISFSHLLNLHLPNIINLSELERHKEIIGSLNWARQRRNEIVHSGTPEEKLIRTSVEKSIDAFSKLVEFVKSHK